MIVDDEESIRTAVGQLLKSSGFGKVTTCADGSEALQELLNCINECCDYKDGDLDEPSNIKQRKPTPDCLVTDLRMPVMDGLELIRRIRQQSPPNQENGTEEEWRKIPSSSSPSSSFVLRQQLAQIPIVILTAKGMVQDRIDGYDAGADSYLSKPFAPEELIAICDQVLERYQVESSYYSCGGGSSDSNGNSNDGNCPQGQNLDGISADVQVAELKRALDEIKDLLLRQGGGGIGNGYVERTGVFLTKDERQVLELLSDGLMTKEIASQTQLSTRRIEQLLTRMFRKAGVKNRTELVRWAVATGNVDRM
jgi:DNA-binding NarL/FixJ family response regulator